MTDYRGVVPMAGDIITPEALASLVGQTCPILRRPGDHSSIIGRATITHADQVAAYAVLDFTTEPEHQGEVIAEALMGHLIEPSTLPENQRLADVKMPAVPISMGHTVADAEADEDGHRVFKDIRLVQVGPVSMAFSLDEVLGLIAEREQ